MTPSVVGLIVALIVALTSRLLGSATLIGLPAALAFGATAFATIPALGGASPQIYTLFALALLIAPFVQRHGVAMLAHGAARQPMTLALLALIVHAAASAWLMPRLFAGRTSVFVVDRANGGVVEALLAPGSGNISQTAYFIVGALACVWLMAAARDETQLRLLGRGFLLWALLNIGLGAFDLLARSAGAGDVLEVIRTAAYAMLTDTEHAGFFRIAGGQSEASAFGAAIFAVTVYCMTFARVTGDRRMGALGLMALALTLLSTSSTAYACLALYAAALAGMALVNLLRGRVHKADFSLLYMALAGVAVGAMLYLSHPTLFDPALKLLDEVVFNKASSASAAERGYWNARSLETFFETAWLGVGMGSSRASNWAIAVLSQTGAIGAALQLLLVVVLLRPLPTAAAPSQPVLALHESARSAGLASIVAATISGASADPGMLFFICVATTLACRRVASESGAHSALAPPRAQQADPSGAPWPAITAAQKLI